MATYTDNYQLEKPVASDAGNVAVLNRNSDKIDTILHASQVSIADAYDDTATYNTGDVVMYEFFLYECLDDNVTGTWDSTKWQRTTAATSGGGGGGGSSTLAGLTDVTITSPTDGQGLIWDATAGKWVNGASGGESSYTVISDTTQTTTAWGSPITVSCNPLDYDVIIFDISNAVGNNFYCITYPQTMPLDSGDGQAARFYVLSNNFTCFPARFADGMGMFTSTNTTLNVNKVTGIKFGGGSGDGFRREIVYEATDTTFLDITVDLTAHDAYIFYVNDATSQSGAPFMFTADRIAECLADSKPLTMYQFGSAGYCVYNIISTGLERNSNIGGFVIIAIEAVDFNGGGSSEVKYSTTERKIGKWVDGSDLYEISWDVTGTYNGNTQTTVTDPTNGGSIKEVSGIIEYEENGDWLPMPVGYYFIYPFNGNTTVMCNIGNGTWSVRGDVTVRYTKSSSS